MLKLGCVVVIQVAETDKPSKGDRKVMNARQTFVIIGLQKLAIAKEALEQFELAWQERNGIRLKSMFVAGAIRQSLLRVKRDVFLEARRNACRDARHSRRTYRDPKTNVTFDVDVRRRTITAVVVDALTNPTLHNEAVGFVHVTDHAEKRFVKRYLSHLKTRTPTGFDAHEFLWGSFGRAVPTKPKDAERRLLANEGRPVHYFLDEITGLRYIVSTENLALVTVEIPYEK